jgi:DNA-binding SARP family transcriptional activator
MGDVEICDGVRAAPLPRAGERCVLASLALDSGRGLHVDTLVDRLWGDDPPANAVQTIASYIRTVRRAIERAGGRRDWLLNRRPATYQLDIDPNLVDYHRFTALVARARRRRRDGNPAEAAALFREALQQRNAEALSNVTGQWAANRRYAIEQEHLDAVCAMYEQQLTIGEHTAVATHATHLVLDVVPTDRMIVLAIHGLARSGQHATIPGFLARATQRMWDTAQARPSPQVIAVGRQLVDNPSARLPSPQPAPGGPQPADQLEADCPDDSGYGAMAGASPPADGVPAAPEQVRGDLITMTAEGNRQVFQAGRDQYITGG